MKPEDSVTKCWICGTNEADSGEHRIKVSDLYSIFGDPSPTDPLYFHTAKRKNFKVGSLKAKVLKSPVRICQECNNARTQPHDFAWQHLSEALRSRQPAIASGDAIRPNRIFPYDTARQMRNVHLYFLKLFGCLLLEGTIPIDIAPFSDAILRGRPHPNVYLAFGPAPDPPGKMAGGSDVMIAQLGGRCAFATWFYEAGNLWVNVMYAIDGEKRDGLTRAWHPRLGHRRLDMVTFVPAKK